ncbi:MAG: addiction module protein [Alphaproteobacteria bacterium]|nr:addiction module protein [Alphaproteobacteria bacterium]
MSTAENILQQALDLPEQERVEIAHNLYRSVRPSPEEIDAAWARTASERLEAFKRGELKSQPMDEAIADIRARLLARRG